MYKIFINPSYKSDIGSYFSSITDVSDTSTSSFEVVEFITKGSIDVVRSLTKPNFLLKVLILDFSIFTQKDLNVVFDVINDLVHLSKTNIKFIFIYSDEDLDFVNRLIDIGLYNFITIEELDQIPYLLENNFERKKILRLIKPKSDEPKRKEKIVERHTTTTVIINTKKIGFVGSGRRVGTTLSLLSFYSIFNSFLEVGVLDFCDHKNLLQLLSENDNAPFEKGNDGYQINDLAKTNNCVLIDFGSDIDRCFRYYKDGFLDEIIFCVEDDSYYFKDQIDILSDALDNFEDVDILNTLSILLTNYKNYDDRIYNNYLDYTDNLVDLFVLETLDNEIFRQLVNKSFGVFLNNLKENVFENQFINETFERLYPNIKQINPRKSIFSRILKR